MGMNVNETRREGEPIAGNPLKRVALRHISNECDLPANHRQVGPKRGTAMSVIDQGALINGL
jgi:hypothetical protein